MMTDTDIYNRVMKYVCRRHIRMIPANHHDNYYCYMNLVIAQAMNDWNGTGDKMKWVGWIARMRAKQFMRDLYGRCRRRKRNKDKFGLHDICFEMVDNINTDIPSEQIWEYKKTILQKMINNLSDKQRETIIYCYFMEKKQRDLAVMNEVGESAISQLLNKSLNKLRAMIDDHDKNIPNCIREYRFAS